MFKKISVLRFKRKHRKYVYYSKSLDKYIRIKSVHDWNDWVYEVYVQDRKFGLIPSFSNNRFGHSDTDIRTFVEEAGFGITDF